MTPDSTDFITDAWPALAYQALPLTSQPLPPAAIQRAIAWSQVIPHLEQQWRVYLQGLAIAGVEQWFAERAPDLTVEPPPSTVPQPALAALVDSVYPITVAGRPLTVVVVSPDEAPVIPCPRAIFEVPTLIPAAYLFVRVWEEAEQAQVWGYLTPADWQRQQAAAPLVATADWHYDVPLTWLEPAVDRLLWALRSGTLPQPAIAATPSPATTAIVNLRNRLARLAAQPQTAPLAPWELLSWAEGQLLLRSPDLARQFYDLQWQARTGQPELAAAPELTATAAPSQELAADHRPTLGQRGLDNSINVAHWFHDRLDDMAQALAWVLLPELAVAPAFRSAPNAGFNQVLSQLQHQGVDIPATARGAYQDLKWAGVGVRLYLLTWPLPVDLGTPSEWVLLAIAGPQPDLPLPPGLRLLVRDQIQTLEERSLPPDGGDEYVYVQVVGHYDEQFWLTVDLTRGAVVTLPPLRYDPAIAA